MMATRRRRWSIDYWRGTAAHAIAHAAAVKQTWRVSRALPFFIIKYTKHPTWRYRYKKSCGVWLITS